MKKINQLVFFVALALILAYALKLKLTTFGGIESGSLIREIHRENRENIIKKNRPQRKIALPKGVRQYEI